MAKRSREVQKILKLRVPMIVLLGERAQHMQQVLDWAPGRIIELPQHFTEPLMVQINNKPIARGEAVKIGENFGIRITKVEDRQARIEALKREME